VGAGLDLVTDVDFRRRVMPHQNHRQAGRPMFRRELFDARPQLRKNLFAHPFPIQNFRTHSSVRIAVVRPIIVLMRRLSALFLLFAGLGAAEDWHALLNGKNLDGWEVRGDSTWTVLKDGTLAGVRPHNNPFKEWPLPRDQYRAWAEPQSWLYSKAEFDQFDLHTEYWLPPGGNSGISIRDTSRAKYALPGADHDSSRTPSHIGYEIQILANGGDDKYPTG